MKTSQKTITGKSEKNQETHVEYTTLGDLYSKSDWLNNVTAIGYGIGDAYTKLKFNQEPEERDVRVETLPAIHAVCLRCCNNDKKEVAGCKYSTESDFFCPLWDYRTGALTDEVTRFTPLEAVDIFCNSCRGASCRNKNCPLYSYQRLKGQLSLFGSGA